jgi:diguanylate cyclase (GGDEF)-like protein
VFRSLEFSPAPARVLANSASALAGGASALVGARAHVLRGRRTRPTRRTSLALAAFVVLYLSWQAFDWLPVRREIAGDTLLLVISAAAAWAACAASRHAQGPAQLSGAWRLVALAILGQSAGQLVQLVYELYGWSGYPTWADPLYLSFYPLLLVGVLRFPTARLLRRELIEMVLDGAIVALGGAAVFVYLILGPEVIAARTPLQTAVAVAYPAGDMVLLVALSGATMRSAAAGARTTLRAIAVAIALFAVGDLLYGYVALHGTYHGGDPVDTLYVLAFACFILAARSGRPPEAGRTSSAVPAAVPAAPGQRVLWLPSLGIAAGVAVVVAKEWGQPFFPDISIAILVAVIAALVIVRQMLSQASIRRSNARLAQAQGIAGLGSWEWDYERNLVERSEIDQRLYGLDPSSSPTPLEPAMSQIHPDDRARVEAELAAALRDRLPFSYEFRIVRADGELRTLLTRGEVEQRGGDVRAVRGTHLDITERKQMEVQLQYQADHDPLTGLYNRRRFAEELDDILRLAARYKRGGALLMLDFDDFKVLNDTRGHAAGDLALKALAGVLAERLRASDVMARLGGDEFAVVLPECDERQALAVAESIRRGLAACDTGALGAAIRVTVGLVVLDGSSELHATEALIAADIALYEGKENGKDRVQVYHGRASAAVVWVRRIRTALDDERFVLYAQPMLDLRSGERTHSELLIRMLGDDGETIAPDVFLPTAEHFGLINEIDRWVAGEGLRLAAAGERVSINLSAQSIGDERIVAELTSAIANGANPKDVIFEITESAAVRNIGEARAFTERLIALGCEVALDDFGTGFGSFTYLKHLPARYVKIDMEFVRELAFNQTDRQIVDSINRVAHSLGMLTIAEGVEDAATLELLRDFGVDRAQGFHVGRPHRLAPPVAPRRLPRRRVAKIGV